jgi:hypothetical protein
MWQVPFDTIINVINTVFPQVIPTLKGYIDQIKQTFWWLVEQVRLAIDALGKKLIEAVAYFVELKNKAVAAVMALYEGVKTWLQDKMTAVIDYVMAKIRALQQVFADLYDAVVGHSYIPDMVEESGDWFSKFTDMLEKTGKDVNAFNDTVAGIMAPDASMSLEASSVANAANQNDRAAEAMGWSGSTFTVNQFIQTPEVNSFREASRQTYMDARRGMGIA